MSYNWCSACPLIPSVSGWVLSNTEDRWLETVLTFSVYTASACKTRSLQGLVRGSTYTGTMHRRCGLHFKLAVRSGWNCARVFGRLSPRHRTGKLMFFLCFPKKERFFVSLPLPPPPPISLSLFLFSDASTVMTELLAPSGPRGLLYFARNSFIPESPANPGGWRTTRLHNIRELGTSHNQSLCPELWSPATGLQFASDSRWVLPLRNGESQWRVAGGLPRITNAVKHIPENY